jgi:hypothetical protein
MSNIGAASLAALLSPARAEASRRNGAKSRGPKTPEGKARSSQNALRHGLGAQKYLVLPEEDAAAFNALEAALLAELAPEGALQSVLARRIVSAAWRLERAERLEVELFAKHGVPILGYAGPGMALIRDGNGPRSFDTLLRYRGGTLAEFWRALRTLKALQAEQAAARPEPSIVPAPRLSEPHEVPIEPESCGKPRDCAPRQAASGQAPPPAVITPAVIPCDQESAPTKLPDEPESRGKRDNSGRPSGRATPRRGDPSPAEPAPLPIERAPGGSPSLLAGTALVPPGRRKSA